MTQDEFVAGFLAQYPPECDPGKTGTWCRNELDVFHDACLANAKIQDEINGNQECIAACNLGWSEVFHGKWP